MNVNVLRTYIFRCRITGIKPTIYGLMIFKNKIFTQNYNYFIEVEKCYLQHLKGEI